MTTSIQDRPAIAPAPQGAVPRAMPAVAAMAQPRTPLIPPRSAPPTGPTFDHFVLAQLPLALAVALVFGIIAFAAVRFMPATGAATPAEGGGGAALITAFTSEPAAQQITVEADPAGGLKWTKATYEAQAGDVSFVVVNKSVSPHNFAVEGANVKAQSKNFGGNTTTTYTIKGLPAGEYLIVCNYPGHKAAGMIAKLIVK